MWLYFFLTYLLNIAATTLSKEYAVNGNKWLVVLAFVFTGLSSIAWAIALKKGFSLTTGTPLISISLMTTIVLIGFLYYGESLGLSKIVGIILGMIAIILIAK